MAMTTNTVVRARIDERIKEEASALLAAMGLTVSDAFRIMLTRVAREKALPFEPLIPNETTIAAMREARAGKPNSFDSAGALRRGATIAHKTRPQRECLTTKRKVLRIEGNRMRVV
jgi:DNA-damage-inducible protein J